LENIVPKDSEPAIPKLFVAIIIYILSLDLLPQNIPVFVSRCAGAQFRVGLWAALEKYTLNFLQMSEYSIRALLRTDNGYLSLRPRRTRVGDQVWVVEQARALFVLRPISKSQKSQKH
jgi:hypothetical protein